MTQEQQTVTMGDTYSADPHSEEARITDFQETLARLSVHPLTVRIDVGQADPVAVVTAEFFRTDFQAEPTFYALPEISHELNEDLEGFEPIQSGERSSRHGVFFGTLIFSSGLEMSVAVKPHHTAGMDDPLNKREDETSCLNDYFTNVAARKCGFEGLQPVGFILDDQGCPYSLTVLDEELDSLDSIDWSKFFEPGYETTGMSELLYKTALGLAVLHNNGDSYHGDFAPRNVGTTPYGQVSFHDWEKGKITNAPYSDIEERFGKTWLDVKTFMIDMVKPRSAKPPGIGMFEKCTGDWWTNFKDVFLDDYSEARIALAQQGSHHMRKLRETREELTQLEHALHLEIDRWQQAAGIELEPTV